MQDQLDISIKSLLRVAIPISLGTFVQFVVSFTDNYFVAQLNGNAMSAVSFVGLIYITLAMLGVGLSNATQIMVARRKGEGNNDLAGQVVGNAFRLAFVIALIQFVLIYFIVPTFLNNQIEHTQVRQYMIEFIDYRAFGFFAYSFTLVLISFWSGIAQTRILLYSTLITAVVNIILDYALVFGHWGMPQMGVSGAALATIISEYSALIFVGCYTWFYSDKFLGGDSVTPDSRSYNLKKWLVQGCWKHTRTLVRLGGPIALQLMLSLGVWVVFYSFIETMGESELQASFIVRQIYMLAFISIGGFSTTAKTFVSGLIAEKRQAELHTVMKRLMWLNLLGVVFFSHGLWLYPQLIASQFTDNPLTIQQAVDTMHIVLPAIITFAFTSILLGVVEGSGNTVAGFLVELCSVALYLIAAYVIVFDFQWPVHLVWTADYLYFGFIGIFSWLYLRNGKWKYTHL